MKKRISLLILVGEAALLIALTVLVRHVPALFSSAAAFPFEQAAGGLRLLSQAGALGNGAALALMAGASSLPLLAALKGRFTKETAWEKSALLLLSVVLPLGLYGMMNPQLLRSRLCETAFDVKTVHAMLGGTIWAFVILYTVLRLLRLFRQGDKEKLLGYMKRSLYALCILLTALAALSLTHQGIALAGLPARQAGSAPAADIVVGAFRMIAGLLPYLLDIAVIVRGLELLNAAETEDPGKLRAAAGRLNTRCCAALGITVAAAAVSNAVGVIAMPWLTDTAVSVCIPVLDIVFVLAVLLVSRLLVENQKLRDNDRLFI